MKKNILLFLFITTVLSCSGQQKKQYDVAAFVWPAYYNEPRFAEIGIFKEGDGEWEVIRNAKPKFDGHEQPKVPLWGYLDQSDPKTQEKAIETALEYGVNTFIFDWYWYDDRPFLEDVLNKGFLKASNNEKMKFYIMWANHTANAYWDPYNPNKGEVYWRGEVSREVYDGFLDRLVNYFKRPNYYKIDGKPVFCLYEVSTFVNGVGGEKEAKEALEALEKKCVEAGFPGVHIQGIVWGQFPSMISGVPGDKNPTQDNTVKLLGLESLTNYQWVHLLSPNLEYKLWGEKAQSKYADFSKFSVPYFPHVSAGWDSNSRFNDSRQPCVTNVTPEQFETFLKVAKDYVDTHPDQVPLITINSWNEWSEGSYLEPDTKNGYKMLEAIKKVFK